MTHLIVLRPPIPLNLLLRLVFNRGEPLPRPILDLQQSLPHLERHAESGGEILGGKELEGTVETDAEAGEVIVVGWRGEGG
jgi:hypothetical protein